MFSFLYSKKSNKVTLTLEFESLIDAVNRNDIEMIKAAVSYKGNNIGNNEMILLQKSIEQDRIEIMDLLLKDYYQRSNPGKHNEKFLELARSKNNYIIILNILNTNTVMPSYNQNILYKHYDSNNNKAVLHKIITHPNFIVDESIKDSVDKVKKEMDEERKKKDEEERKKKEKEEEKKEKEKEEEKKEEEEKKKKEKEEEEKEEEEEEEK